MIVSLGGSSNPNSGWDIQAQRLTRDGRIATGWPSASVFLCTAEGTQFSPLAVPDGTGGALVAWLDDRDTLSTDIHAHHVQGDGAMAPGWPVDGLLVVPGNAADGIAVSAALSDRSVQTISLGVADELLVTWMGQRNGNLDAYAQRLRPDGSIAPGWTIGGSPVVTQVASQFYPLIMSDVASGALVVWSDLRNGNFDVYG